MSQILSSVSSNHFRQRLRSPDGTDYVIPPTNTNKSGERAFSVTGPSHWNSPSESLRTATDQWSFKKNLKTLKLTILICVFTSFFVYSLRDICNAWLIRLVVSRT